MVGFRNILDIKKYAEIVNDEKKKREI